MSVGQHTLGVAKALQAIWDKCTLFPKKERGFYFLTYVGSTYESGPWSHRLRNFPGVTTIT
jgi:hypothetical protein